MATIDKLDIKKCTGCALCEAVCPKDAIAMHENEEGFLVPNIDMEKCIECGICADKCPQFLNNHTFNDNIACFAIQCKDNIRNFGSSGGVFKAIADYTLKLNGLVCGAAFDKSQLNLRHVIVEDKEECGNLFKSKYLQSDTTGIYKKIKLALEKGRLTVFSGCPCQIDALKIYLDKEYNNLITVDLLCHGVPSPLAYKIFISELNSQNREIKKVDFRDKKGGWGTLLSIDFGDEIKYEAYNSSYFRAFLSGLNMRECCFQCPYANKSRVGDITLGDFWGIQDFDKSLNDNKGTSLVMCNSSKGYDLINNLKSVMKICQPISLSNVLEISKNTNWALSKPSPKNDMRKCFFYHLKRDGFYKAVRYAEKAIIDVGILGWWIQTDKTNYGSTLTDYALGRYLSSLGLSIAYVSPPNFDRADAGYFNKRYNYRMTMKYSYDDMKENNRYIDTFIVGSDVLWYYDAFIQNGFMFMLDFVDDEKKKIAYATSFGNTIKFFPKEEMPRAKYLLNRFDSISLREIEGVDIIKKHFNIDAQQVLDPVFLCDISDWKLLADNASSKTKERFVFAYLMDPDINKANQLKNIAKKMKCKLVTIADRQDGYQEKIEILSDCGIITNADLETYIYHLMNAEFIITDSFHGLCFSLIFRKPFYALINKVRGASRFMTLSSLFDIRDKLIDDISEIENMSKDELLQIDYDIIAPKIDYHIEKSKSWLKNALASPKKEIVQSEIDSLSNDVYLLKKQVEQLLKMKDLIK
ncbi:MAG: polysaccharide pyruvyl transferase family protein [Bacteroides sp.]|nr:polysaccharide pyruvyl transferase family protein [Bacillota bacterium]MCM1393279.1 polysaccharide pyruvyl transferase family protein [[Eubacterium] siraeum]MCM1455418.1 polysaccharide pyruvyl transferase family protein [Bacteroides sp.]